MTKEQLLLILIQKVQQEPNDQLLGQWLRNYIKNLDLGESNNSNNKNLLLG